jgi:hypothetical protein
MNLYANALGLPTVEVELMCAQVKRRSNLCFEIRDIPRDPGVTE